MGQRVSSSEAMRPGRITGWLAPPAAVALALIIGGGSARADVCVVVNPVLELGCRDGQGASAPATAPTTATAQSASAPEESEPVRRSSTEPRYDPRRLAITFKRGTRPATVRAVIARAGTTLEQAIPKINAYLVGVDPDRRAEALDSLRTSPSVASASQELLAEALDTSPDDNDWPRQEGLRVVGFQKAWDVTQGSSRVIVAVIDTGVDAGHPDLRGALVPGYDLVSGDADPADDHGHGTAVAGVIAARSNNHEGLAGICWRCSVMPIKVLDASGSGDDTLIAAGIVWATDHRAQVINLSLGGPGASQELSNAIGYAAGKGVIVVAAAGNSGTTTQFFPAADPRSVSVAATTVADHRYSWSNFGPWVRVAAPGCNLAPLLGGGYGTFCGTSSATPLVTGLIALELSAEPAATAEQVEQALVRAAVPLPELVQYGRIDAGKTLSLLRPARANAVFRGTIGPRARTRTYRVVVGPGELAAGLQFTGSGRLALLLAPAGRAKPLARVAGPSPLQLRTSVSAGAFTLRVTGATKTSFVLSMSYERRRQP
jgi:subtilisin family serine protease